MNKILSLFCFFAIIAAIYGQIPNINAYPPGKNTAVFAEGGRNKFGTDVYAQAQTRLWQSQNQRHEFHGGATYGQHIGGPYGSSRPNVGVGGTYVYRYGGRR